MSFLKSVGGFLGEVAGGAVNQMKEANEKSKQFKDQYSDCSEDELLDALVRATKRKQIVEGGAIRTLLKTQHGYDEESISQAVRSRM